MRCPDCNKFVSYDEPQVEESDQLYTTQGQLVGEIRVVLPCAECGTELKEGIFEICQDIDHECDEEAYAEYQGTLEDEHERTPWEDDPEYAVEESDNWEYTERLEDKDKHGKQIKNMRYMKKFCGYSGTATVKCLKCGEVISIELSDEMQASYFDEL